MATIIEPDLVAVVRQYARILYESVAEYGDNCPETPLFLAFQAHMDLKGFNSLVDALKALGAVKTGVRSYTLTAVPSAAKMLGLA
jgi:hypothetical protein